MEPTQGDLYYLRSIQRQLRDYREEVIDGGHHGIGLEALNDNLDWLDCFIDMHARRLAEPVE